MDNTNNSLISGKKILIVEDDIFINSLFAEKLFEKGATVFSAKKEDDVFKILKIEKVDIISLDLLLPGTSGFEILKKIKDEPSTKEIPVIILSNLGQKSDVDMGLKLGAKKFLIKALYSMDELIEQFSEVLK
jgi:DNA-binding response OmpR family regulator